jgi:hypothetical protein
VQFHYITFFSPSSHTLSLSLFIWISIIYQYSSQQLRSTEVILIMWRSNVLQARTSLLKRLPSFLNNVRVLTLRINKYDFTLPLPYSIPRCSDLTINNVAVEQAASINPANTEARYWTRFRVTIHLRYILMLSSNFLGRSSGRFPIRFPTKT